MAWVVLTLSCVGSLAAQQASEPVVIGIVRDGSPGVTNVVPMIETELQSHLPGGTTVRFKEDSNFNAQWNADRVPDALRAALDDPEVDIVLVDGLYATLESARDDLELDKSVVSAYLQRSDVFRLPLSGEDRSMKPNLSFTVLSLSVESDLRTFHELVPFDSVTVTLAPDDMQLVPGLAARLESLEQNLAIDIRFATLADDVSDSLGAIGDAEAVYLTQLPQLTPAQKEELIQSLTRQRIPTFSMAGDPELELGALATLTPDVTGPLVRRVALNLARIIRGESTTELPVLMAVDARLRINGRTAAAVGFRPSWETRVFATFLHEDMLDERGAAVLELADAFSESALNNAFLSIQDELVESVRQERGLAKSALLPQVAMDVRYRNSNVGEPLQPLFPRDSSFLGLSIGQMIFDDQAITNYRSSLRLFEGSEFQREADRIGILGDTGLSFYGLALTQAFYRIAVDNLRLTETFLELAQLRREVGYSGADEILRWEAAGAQSRADLFASIEDVEAARITLNRVLGGAQGRRWLPEPISVDPEVFPFLGGRLDPIFDRPEDVDRLPGALVPLAVQNSPEIKAINKQLDALDLQVAALGRRFYVPSGLFTFNLNRQLTGGARNNPSSGNLFWDLRVRADYPLFLGGQRLSALRKSEADGRALDRQRVFTEQLIEQETRTAFRRAEASFPRIRFGQQAVEAATGNLEIVQDKYSEGIVDVTDLTSAQNERLIAEQLAAAAVFDFLIDLVNLQRALSWFEAEKTEAERESFYQEIVAILATIEGREQR